MPKQISQELKSVLEKSQQLNVPYVDLTGKIIIPDVLREVSEEAANFYRFVPIAKNGKVIEVGMVNPDDLKSREAMCGRSSGLKPVCIAFSAFLRQKSQEGYTHPRLPSQYSPCTQNIRWN